MKNLSEKMMLDQITLLKRLGFDRETLHKMIDLAFDLAEEKEKNHEN